MDNNNDEFRGSTESAVQSKVKIDINKVLQEAYETTKQKRTPIAGAIVWAGFILIVAMLLVFALSKALSIDTEGQAFEVISLAVNILIWSPLMAGIQIMALRNVIGDIANINQAFAFLTKPWAIITTALIITVISQAPFLAGFEHFVGFIWVFFFQIIFSLAIIITATGQATPLNAVMLSFNLVLKRFVSFLILNIVVFIVSMLIAIPVIILGVLASTNSLILVLALFAGAAAIYLVLAWVAPTYFHAIAIFYRDIFAVKPVSSRAERDISNDSDKGDNQSFNA